MEVWTATKQESGHWLFEWDADSGDPFDIWLNGELLAEVTGGSYTAEEDGYETSPPPLEIVSDESGSVAESGMYPPFVIIQWRTVANAEAYIVEQYVNGNWIQVKTIMETGAGYLIYRSFPLTDCVSSSFRVFASDIFGNTGTPVTFSFYVARNPAPPDVEFSMESGGIVVSEA